MGGGSKYSSFFVPLSLLPNLPALVLANPDSKGQIQGCLGLFPQPKKHSGEVWQLGQPVLPC